MDDEASRKKKWCGVSESELPEASRARPYHLKTRLLLSVLSVVPFALVSCLEACLSCPTPRFGVASLGGPPLVLSLGLPSSPCAVLGLFSGGKARILFRPCPLRSLFARSFALPSAFAWLSSSALQRGPLNLKRRKLGKPRTYSLTPGRPPPLLQREAGESAAAGWREKAEARCLLEA